MNGEPDFVRIIRLHKKWADGYTLLSQLVITPALHRRLFAV